MMGFDTTLHLLKGVAFSIEHALSLGSRSLLIRRLLRVHAPQRITSKAKIGEAYHPKEQGALQFAQPVTDEAAHDRQGDPTRSPIRLHLLERFCENPF